MNILVANISTFTKDTEITYTVNMPKCKEPTYKARHTNESIIKCLANMQEVIETGGIGRVIALVSNDAMNKQDDRFANQTAFDYYSDIATSLGVKDIIKVPSEDGVEIILKNICDNVDINDKVYIDSAGGKRNISNIIQLLIKILKHKGIDNPFSLYSDINFQNNTGTIESTQNFDRIADLSEAFNEFMTTGKSDQLNDCLKDNSSIQYKNLVKAMAEFSDNIRLGAVEMLEDTINALRSAIDECLRQEPNDMESVIIHQFIPIIRDKFFVDQTQPDYCKLIHWCLDNGLVQQALTIFNEKIPIALFEKGIVSFCDSGAENSYKKSHQTTATNPLNSADWQTNAFYQVFLGEDKSLIKDVVKYLESGIKSNKINSFIQTIKSQEKLFRDGQNEKMHPAIKKILKEQNIKDWNALKHSLSNNGKAIKILLGISSEKEDTISNKFNIVSRLENGTKQNNGIVSNVSAESIVAICFGYLYVKSMRNTTNHASSEASLDEKQKKELKSKGYNFNTYNLKTIKNNIELALSAIENIKTSDMNKQMSSIKAQPLEGSSRKGGSNNTIQEKTEDIFSPEQIPQLKVVGKIELKPDGKKRIK